MKKIILPFLFFFSLVIIFDLHAYPRFAAYTGSKCADCHVNPDGGSMRQGYGIKYAKDELNMEMFRKIAGKTEFSPQISKHISIGGDVRLAQIDDEVPGRSNFNTFLTMQGDLDVNVKVNNIVNVFLTSGIQIPNFPVKYEAFGMLSKLPLDAYFLAGRFKPAYGIRIVEHRAYQRLYLLNTPYDADAGFELGIAPGDLNLNIGLFNGLNTDFFDQDAHKMVTANADYTFHIKDNVHINLGASVFNNPYKYAFLTETYNRKSAAGFMKIGLFDRVAILGEADFTENTDTLLTRTFFAFGELNVRIIKGVELRAQYEYMQPNRDIENNDKSRYSIGMAFFPFFGFETELMARFTKEHPVEIQDNEFQWNFHFYF
ncbi:hypothetical protein BH10BAC5_BH10BAC5_13200 [soil metagenome]